MGTFHDGKHDLHGITLAVTAGDKVYVGRCDDMNADSLHLVDVDAHVEGEGGRTNSDWLARAAAFGVTPRSRRLMLPLSQVQDSVRSAITTRRGRCRSRGGAERDPPDAAAKPTTCRPDREAAPKSAHPRR